MRTTLFLLIILLTSVACSLNENTVVESVDSITTKVARVTSTSELMTAAETTVPATITPLKTLTPTVPTVTSIPATHMPNPSATPLHTHYDLPTWLNDPETAVLMAVMHFEPHSEDIIAFLNVSSGKLFTLPLPSFASHLAWGQDKEGIYFEFNHTHVVGDMRQNLYLERVYIATGTSQQIPPINLTDYGTQSPDSRYIARIIREDEQLNVTLEDLETTKITTLVDPFKGHYPSYIKMDWSSQGNLLSVLRYKFGTPLGTGLTVHTQTGEIYRQFENKEGYIWSLQNNHEILYLQGNELGSRQPCLLDIQENNDFCFEEILSWRENFGVKTDLYQWTHNDNQISFVYWQRGVSGLCFIDVDSHEIDCPIDWETLGGMDEVGGINHIIEAPDWSPDGRYIRLITSYGSIESDDRTITKIITIEPDGDDLQIWGYGYRPAPSWRPSIPSQ